MRLSSYKCVSWRGGAPTVTNAEIVELRPHAPEWELTEECGFGRLRRVLEFADFAQALAFMVEVGALAESEGHHPALLTERGARDRDAVDAQDRRLHRNDLILAAKADAACSARARARD